MRVQTRGTTPHGSGRGDEEEGQQWLPLGKKRRRRERARESDEKNARGGNGRVVGSIIPQLTTSPHRRPRHATMDYEYAIELHDFLNGFSLCDFGDLEIDYAQAQDHDLVLGEGTELGHCDPTVATVFASPTGVNFTSTVLVDDVIDVEDTTDIEMARPIKIEQAARPKRVAAVHGAGRYKVRSSGAPRRPRDRRRNPQQRKRENEKRRLKQDEYKNKRDFCFEREALLREDICEVIEHLAQEYGIPVEKAIPHLPSELVDIMRRADAALRRYRDFTGKKHTLMKLNSFREWPAIYGRGEDEAYSDEEEL